MDPERDGILADLEILYQEGSRDEVMRRCTALLAIPGIVIATDMGTDSAWALRQFLVLAVERSDAHYGDPRQHSASVAAALTAIRPQEWAHGGRGATKQRIRNAAEILYGPTTVKAVERPGKRLEDPANRIPFFTTYAEEIERLASDLSDESVQSEYLARCGVVGRGALEGRNGATSMPAPRVELAPGTTDTPAGTAQACLASPSHLLPISRDLLAVLDAVRNRHRIPGFTMYRGIPGNRAYSKMLEGSPEG